MVSRGLGGPQLLLQPGATHGAGRTGGICCFTVSNGRRGRSGVIALPPGGPAPLSAKSVPARTISVPPAAADPPESGRPPVITCRVVTTMLNRGYFSVTESAR